MGVEWRVLAPKDILLFVVAVVALLWHFGNVDDDTSQQSTATTTLSGDKFVALRGRRPKKKITKKKNPNQIKAKQKIKHEAWNREQIVCIVI